MDIAGPEDCGSSVRKSMYYIACVQTSPISFSACNKGNRRRLHAGKYYTVQLYVVG